VLSLPNMLRAVSEKADAAPGWTSEARQVEPTVSGGLRLSAYELGFGWVMVCFQLVVFFLFGGFNKRRFVLGLISRAGFAFV